MNGKKCTCGERPGFTFRAKFKENGFDHTVSFAPGFTCERLLADRNDPHNHGTGCVDLIFLVSNESGAVQFTVMTGWYPNWKETRYGRGAGLSFSPFPSDLGYHSPKPMYEDQPQMSGDCPHVVGGVCYYDGSGLNAEKPFNILVTQGEAALWAFLEEYHRDTFTDERPNP